MTWFAALCDSVCTGCSGTMEVLELKEGKQTRQRFFHRHRLDEGNNPLWSVNLCVQWFQQLEATRHKKSIGNIEYLISSTRIMLYLPASSSRMQTMRDTMFSSSWRSTSKSSANRSRRIRVYQCAITRTFCVIHCNKRIHENIVSSFQKHDALTCSVTRRFNRNSHLGSVLKID